MRISIFLLLVMLIFPTYGQRNKEKAMNDKQQIERLYEQMYRAMVEKDTVTFLLVKRNDRWLFTEAKASTY